MRDGNVFMTLSPRSRMTVAAESLDTAISRADGVQGQSSGTVLEGYTFLGLGTVVQRSHPETGIDLTYISQSGDPNPPPSCAATGGDRYTGLDQFGRVVDQYYVNPSTPSTPTDDFQYAFDRDGNPLYKNIVNGGTTAAGFSQLYHANGVAENSSYDSLGRLIGFAQGALSASGNNGSELDTVSTASTTQSWSLDALGNWSSVTTNGTAQTRSYNGQNQLSAVGGATTPTYDDNGNMTKDQNGTTYAYDAWNRMVSALSGTNAEDYGYLAGGQRASVAVSRGATTFSYFNNAWQELEVDNNTGVSGSAVVQDTYVWGLANVNELVARDDASGNRLYAQQDANWDVTALVGKVAGTWQVVERFVYTAYGTATVLNASWASAADANDWLYRYQAGKYDGLSGLYNFRNRDYSPSLGRWLEADPAGYVQGANLYEANLGAPISHVDPYGLTSDTGSEGDGNNLIPNPPPCSCGCGNPTCGGYCNNPGGRPNGPGTSQPSGSDTPTPPTTGPSPSTQPTTGPSDSTGGPPIGGYPPTQPTLPLPPVPRLHAPPKPPTTRPTPPTPPHPAPPEPTPPSGGPQPPVPAPRPPRGHKR